MLDVDSGWTTDRVLQIAPDPASAKAGQGLATARKWVSLGTAEELLWGECQGSGSKPYQVRVDLSEPAFKCSCPSRKFPCKHAIGLMLLFAASDGSVSTTPLPAWVQEWSAGRSEKKQKKAEKASAPPAPVDAEAQARRRIKRLDRIAEGLAALSTWSQDLVRSGIAAAPSRGYAFFEEPARRMVDAQAPGVARMLRDLGTLAASGAGWQQPFLESLGRLHLLICAFDRREQLPPDTIEDVMTALGVPRNQDEVVTGPGIQDRWQVIAREREIEDALTIQRAWLFGTSTRQPALILDFAHRSTPLDTSLIAGTTIDAELCFFPGNGVRAAIKNKAPAGEIEQLAGYATLDEMCAAYSSRLSRQPWLDELMLPLRDIMPQRAGEQWCLVDSQDTSLDASMADDAAWTARAISGGWPIDAVAGFDGRRLRPIAVVSGGEYVSLDRATTGAEA